MSHESRKINQNISGRSRGTTKGVSYDVSSGGVVHVNPKGIVQSEEFNTQLDAASRVVAKSRAKHS